MKARSLLKTGKFENVFGNRCMALLVDIAVEMNRRLVSHVVGKWNNVTRKIRLMF